MNATYSDETEGTRMQEGLIGDRVQTGADATLQLDGIAPDEAATLQAELEGGLPNAVTVWPVTRREARPRARRVATSSAAA